jgi:hypothetical protein
VRQSANSVANYNEGIFRWKISPLDKKILFRVCILMFGRRIVFHRLVHDQTIRKFTKASDLPMLF